MADDAALGEDTTSTLPSLETDAPSSGDLTNAEIAGLVLYFTIHRQSLFFESLMWGVMFWKKTCPIPCSITVNFIRIIEIYSHWNFIYFTIRSAITSQKTQSRTNRKFDRYVYINTNSRALNFFQFKNQNCKNCKPDRKPEPGREIFFPQKLWN